MIKIAVVSVMTNILICISLMLLCPPAKITAKVFVEEIIEHLEEKPVPKTFERVTAIQTCKTLKSWLE